MQFMTNSTANIYESKLLEEAPHQEIEKRFDREKKKENSIWNGIGTIHQRARSARTVKYIWNCF